MEKIGKMGKFLFLLTFVISIFGRLSILADFDVNHLKTGDVILLDMDCWSCQMIEDETFGPYSHSGVILKKDKKIYVGQSLGEVYLLELDKFLAFSAKSALVLRPSKMNHLKREFFTRLYFDKYDGIPFDHSFTWDDESLYCSEFIYKILDDIIDFKNFREKPMNYKRNWDFWESYFGHRPPQGKLGISPNDFMRSDEFYKIGELN